MKRFNRPSLLTRAFVWSVVLEPMLFFVLFERQVSGVTGNAARLLQVIVITILVLRVATAPLSRSRTTWSFPNPTSALYRDYLLYFVVVSVAGVVGIATGAYYVPHLYELEETASAFANALSSPSIRPLFEYVVTVYYFVYFVVLPRYLLRTTQDIEYFFSVFNGMFILSFALGALDFVFALAGRSLVPRHIADWRTVGARFHGLAGEPRQAFVYLFLGLAIFHLRAFYRGVPLSKWWVLGIVLAAIATQSASGLVGLLCFLGLLPIYILDKLSVRRLAQATSVAVLMAALLVVALAQSARISDYSTEALQVWDALEKGEALPPLMAVQRDNIYPLYDLTVKFRNMNLLPLMIGSGLGSASAVSNRLSPSDSAAFTNPNSQLVRIAYESGVLGLYFFTMAFVRPVKIVSRGVPQTHQRRLLFMALLVLACSFGVRSAANYIYLGLVLATFRVLKTQQSSGIGYSPCLDRHFPTVQVGHG